MTRPGEVLVAIMNNRQDMAIAQEQHWYRIPISSVEKFLKRRWPPEWLAFYQTSIFGSERYTVSFYAKVLDITVCDRSQLFPHEPPNAKSHKRYHKLILSPLQKLPQPIVSHRKRRITFISTTLHKLTLATEINDLYDDSPLEDRIWQACKSLQISAERQERIKIKENTYFLDFAIYCVRGNINIEADGDRWHSDRKRIPLDNLRDNDLGTYGWRTLRFNTTQVKEQMGQYCIPTVVENIDRLGGLVEQAAPPLLGDTAQGLKYL
jgi:very-short-patch-repair endonuclease